MNPAADPFNLQRFVDAQDGVFDEALAELKAGAKRSHWMWFIFPQIAGLGQSATSRHFAIASINEAQAYLHHPLLGPRLMQCVDAVLAWAGKLDAVSIFGAIDATKFCSSLTLFAAISDDTRFDRALDAFFDGNHDKLTLALLRSRGGI